MASEKSQYHHGDLRNTLMRIGTDLVLSEGIEKLSLREVAKRAGVSHNAPYQHFDSREELVAAVAEGAFRALHTNIEDTLQASGSTDPAARLRGIGRHYVSFMQSHPAYLSLMFGSFPHEGYPDLSQAAKALLEQLVIVIQEGQSAGIIRAGNPAVFAGLVWMTVHGLSTILQVGKLPPSLIGDQSAEDLAETYIDLLFEGIAAR
jgi:AcrR family transcriptional regulator